MSHRSAHRPPHSTRTSPTSHLKALDPTADRPAPPYPAVLAQIQKLLPASNSAKPRQTPTATYRVEVLPKPCLADAAGAAVQGQLPLLGIPGARGGRVGSLYEITGRLTLSQITLAAHQLLADPITQDFLLNGAKPVAELDGRRWQVEVWLKRTVTDPVGESVRRAIAELNLPAPDSVRTGTVYRIAGRLSQAQAERATVQLLANPVIHRYAVTLN